MHPQPSNANLSHPTPASRFAEGRRCIRYLNMSYSTIANGWFRSVRSVGTAASKLLV
jgi:hypothetical protein